MALPATGLYARIRPRLPELIKFCIVGGIGTVIDLGGAGVLYGKYHVGPLEAKAISTAVATVVTYAGSRFWTFKGRENEDMRREAVVFIVLNVIGLLIAEAVVALVTYGLGLHGKLEYNEASVVGTGLATIFRYFAYRRWVFNAPAEQSALASGTAPRVPTFPDYPPWEMDGTYLAPAGASPAAPAPSWQSVGAPSFQPPAPAPYSWDPPGADSGQPLLEEPIMSNGPVTSAAQPGRAPGRHRRS